MLLGIQWESSLVMVAVSQISVLMEDGAVPAANSTSVLNADLLQSIGSVARVIL